MLMLLLLMQSVTIEAACHQLSCCTLSESTRTDCSAGGVSCAAPCGRSFVSLKALKGAMSAMSTQRRGRGSLVSQVQGVRSWLPDMLLLP